VTQHDLGGVGETAAASSKDHSRLRMRPHDAPLVIVERRRLRQNRRPAFQLPDIVQQRAVFEPLQRIVRELELIAERERQMRHSQRVTAAVVHVQLQHGHQTFPRVATLSCAFGELRRNRRAPLPQAILDRVMELSTLVDALCQSRPSASASSSACPVERLEDVIDDLIAKTRDRRFDVACAVAMTIAVVGTRSRICSASQTPLHPAC
jgi:hypothetical protein